MKYLFVILALVFSASGRVAKKDVMPILERGDNSSVQADWGQPPPACTPKTVVETCYVTTTSVQKET